MKKMLTKFGGNWISAAEILPQNDVNVLVLTKNPNTKTGQKGWFIFTAFVFEKNWADAVSGEHIEAERIYWIPFPEIKKTKKGYV